MVRQQSSWRSVLQTTSQNPGCSQAVPSLGNSCKPVNPRDYGDPAYQWQGEDYLVRTAAQSGVRLYLNYYQAPVWAERNVPRLRGSWDSTVVYKHHDLVGYSGKTWIALRDNQNTPPAGNRADWGLFSNHIVKDGGPAGEYAVNRGAWRPDPKAYADFMHAVASRYNGNTPDPCDGANQSQKKLLWCPVYTPPGSKLPRVKNFEIWNESNYNMFQAPHCSTVGTWQGSKPVVLEQTHCPPGDGGVVEDFRQLLNLSYHSIKQAQPDAWITAGGLGAYGGSSTGPEIPPQVFLRQLLCLEKKPNGQLSRKRDCTPAWFDAIAVHPYTFAGNPLTKGSPDTASLGRLPEIKYILDQAVLQKSSMPRIKKQLYANEWGWPTNDSGWKNSAAGIEQRKVNGSPPLLNQTAGVYTAESLYRMWSWGIDQSAWYALNDVSTASSSGSWWGSGLFSDQSVNIDCQVKDCSDQNSETCAKNNRISTTQSSKAYCLRLLPKPNVLRAHRFATFAWAEKSRLGLWSIAPRGCSLTGSRLYWYYRPSPKGRWRGLAQGALQKGRITVLHAVIPNDLSNESRVHTRIRGQGCLDSSIQMPIVQNPRVNSSAGYIPQWYEPVCYKNSIWKPNILYRSNQIVVWRSKAWITTRSGSKGVPPGSNPKHWIQYSGPDVTMTDPLEWGRVCRYQRGEIVHYSGYEWISVKTNNKGLPPEDYPLAWRKASAIE